MAESRTPDAELISEIQQLADEFDETPTSADMRKHGRFSAQTYHRRFGSWNKALQKAGFEPNMEQAASYDTEDMLTALVELKDELNRVPRHRDIDQHTKYSGKVFTQKFGSIYNALEEAGLEWGQRHDATEDVNLIDELQRLADDLDKIPSGLDMRHHGNYSITPYYNKYGDWETALKAAGFEDTPSHGNPMRSPDNPMWKGGVEPYYGPNWFSQRKKARKRDDHSCQGCGMQQDEHLEKYDVKLHVHHIVPFQDCNSPNEANALENLVTLCYQCHRLYEGTQLKPKLISAHD